MKIPGLDRRDVLETGDISYVRLESRDFCVIRETGFGPQVAALAGPSRLKVFPDARKTRANVHSLFGNGNKDLVISGKCLVRIFA